MTRQSSHDFDNMQPSLELAECVPLPGLEDPHAIQSGIFTADDVPGLARGIGAAVRDSQRQPDPEPLSAAFEDLGYREYVPRPRTEPGQYGFLTPREEEYSELYTEILEAQQARALGGGQADDVAAPRLPPVVQDVKDERHTLFEATTLHGDAILRARAQRALRPFGVPPRHYVDIENTIIDQSTLE